MNPECGRCPAWFRGMAIVAIGGQVEVCMARVAAVVVIVLMAAVAGVRCVVVVAVVAGRTIVGYIQVGTVNDPKVIVVGESSRRPARFRGMTFFTGHGQAQRHVIRVAGIVKLRLVAGRALRRCSCKAVCMAIQALERKVRTGKWESRVVVVEIVIRRTGRVAGQTRRTVVNITRYPLVVIIRFRIGMTHRATEIRKIVGIGMAINALTPFPFVLTAVNREILRIVIEGGG